MHVVRWGRSAYETDADMRQERLGAEALGYTWEQAFDAGQLPPPADVLVVTSGVQVDAKAMVSCGSRVVITTTSGYDHIDLEAIAVRGATLLRLPQARRDAVVEHALYGLIRGMRNLPALESAAIRGEWARADLPALAPRSLSGAKVLVVGFGVIGQHMAALLTAFGAKVAVVDPLGVPAPYNEGPLDALLPQVDAVTLHCSLTESSRGLLDAERIAALPAHAVIVNTSRGEVLDVEAAVAAVRAGRLRGLLVDVFPEEPYPELAAGASVPGVEFTPHASGFIADLGSRVATGVIEALAALQRGDTLPYPVTV